MEKTTVGLVSVVASLAVCAAAGLLGYELGWVQFGSVPKLTAAQQLKMDLKNADEEAITLICEVAVSMPVNSLDTPPKVHTETMIAGLDFKNLNGWYQGDFSISESRKGALVMQGSKAVVSRPAMFERFGEMVIGEQFTLDRKDGKFIQTVTFKGDRKVDIIKGYCGKLTRAPY
jgi:hypothetical protein